MSGWKRGDTNELKYQQILGGIFIGLSICSLVNGYYLNFTVLLGMSFLLLFTAKHKSPK